MSGYRLVVLVGPGTIEVIGNASSLDRLHKTSSRGCADVLREIDVFIGSLP